MHLCFDHTTFRHKNFCFPRQVVLAWALLSESRQLTLYSSVYTHVVILDYFSVPFGNSKSCQSWVIDKRKKQILTKTLVILSSQWEPILIAVPLIQVRHRPQGLEWEKRNKSATLLACIERESMLTQFKALARFNILFGRFHSILASDSSKGTPSWAASAKSWSQIIFLISDAFYKVTFFFDIIWISTWKRRNLLCSLVIKTAWSWVNLLTRLE